MSHIAKYGKAKFTNPGVLIKAFEKLGWNVQQKAHIRTYSHSEQQIVFPYVAVNPKNGYDIGLTENPVTHEWELNGDFSMDATIRQQLSGPLNQFEKLQLQYNFFTLADYANDLGGSIDSETLADGTIMGEIEVEVDI
jgi:hypothetical protein